MSRAIYVILLSGMMLLFLSSCAAPKPDKPTVKPSETTTPASVQKPAEKPTPVVIEKTFEEIAAAKAEKQKTDLEHVKNVINMRQVRLRNIYKEEVLSKPSQGTLLVRLSIDDKGMIQNPDVSVDSGSFSPEFIDSVRQEITSWRFLVRSPLTYAFKIELN